MIRIVVLGDLNLDILAHLPGTLPRGGEVRTLIKTTPGGSAANFARIAASQRMKVTFIGCVGDDLTGRLLVDLLEDAGVETKVKRSSLPTGTIISLEDATERTMLCSRGANASLDESWVDPAWFDGASHLHISGYSLLSPPQARAAQQAFKIAKKRGMSISFTAPPANLIRQFGTDWFLSALRLIDWCFLNLAEGKTLTGAEKAEDIADILSQKFAVGALTIGEKGSLAWEGNKRDRGVAEPIEGADTTGAGDAFASGFVVSYLKYRDLKRANRHAADTASSFLRKRGHAI